MSRIIQRRFFIYDDGSFHAFYNNKNHHYKQHILITSDL